MSRKPFGNFSPKRNYHCWSITVSYPFSLNVVKGSQAGETVQLMLILSETSFLLCAFDLGLKIGMMHDMYDI